MTKQELMIQFARHLLFVGDRLGKPGVNGIIRFNQTVSELVFQKQILEVYCTSDDSFGEEARKAFDEFRRDFDNWMKNDLLKIFEMGVKVREHIQRQL